MPITLPSITRRTLLGASLAAVIARDAISAETRVDLHRLALLSDVHIHADKAMQFSGALMWDTFQQAVNEIVALDPAPSALIVNGDCAHFHGHLEDYATFLGGLTPLRNRGMPIHLSLGNHDNRENFLKAIKPPDTPAKDPNAPAVADRLVAVVPMERANLFLLDSLDRNGRMQGVLGEAQLAWLAKMLDARADKPAIVFVHHNPDARPADKRTGLDDTDELFKALAPRKHVKALVFGHTHVWNYSRRDGIHLINLPTTAWTFVPGMARGWVDLKLAEKGATFELNSIDKQHHLHGQKFELAWR